MTTNNTTVKTLDNSIISVKKATPLPVFPKGTRVTVEIDGKQLTFQVGFSSEYQLAAVKDSEEARSLHALLTSAPRENKLAEVTILG